MSKPLDFNKVKKHFLTVTLADEDSTVLMIKTPTKAIMDTIANFNDTMRSVKDESIDGETLDVIYDMCAVIMSHNKNGKTISKEYIENLFDFEDISIFYNAYMDFIREAMSGKN